MLWTKALPSIENLYWFRRSPKIKGEIVLIINDNGTMKMCTASKYGELLTKIVRDYPEYSFSDIPIQEPQEVTTYTDYFD